jgi:23S rRNA (adenine2030-N6)-methyltransferase
MFLLNPPYTLEPLLRQVMPYLVRVLGKDAAASFVIEKGTPVTGAVAARTGAGPRQPVGNARRASPLSGGGSLRLPGQKMGEGRPAAAGRDGQARGAGERDVRFDEQESRSGGQRAPQQRDARPMRNASRGPATGAAPGDRPGRQGPAKPRETSAQQPFQPRTPRNRRG